jgi:hypothetical protein
MRVPHRKETWKLSVCEKFHKEFFQDFARYRMFCRFIAVLPFPVLFRNALIYRPWRNGVWFCSSSDSHSPQASVPIREPFRVSVNARLKELGDKARPACLMGSSDPAARFAMEVFVE